jgi:hypothetical protein
MADNFAFTPGTGATGKAEDLGGGVLAACVKIYQGASAAGRNVDGILPFPIRLAPRITSASVFTRPATDALAYAAGDIIANSTTAASVVMYTIDAARINDEPGRLLSCRLQCSNNSLTNGIFRVHVFNASTGVANGDNGVFTPSNVANWLGSFDVTLRYSATDGAFGVGIPTDGNYISFTPVSGSQNVRCALEARAAYTPTSAETFTLQLVTE